MSTGSGSGSGIRKGHRFPPWAPRPGRYTALTRHTLGLGWAARTEPTMSPLGQSKTPVSHCRAWSTRHMEPQELTTNIRSQVCRLNLGGGGGGPVAGAGGVPPAPHHTALPDGQYDNMMGSWTRQCMFPSPPPAHWYRMAAERVVSTARDFSRQGNRICWCASSAEMGAARAGR